MRKLCRCLHDPSGQHCRTGGLSVVLVAGHDDGVFDGALPACRRYAAHGLLSIGMLSTCQHDLAAKTRKLGLVMHQRLTAEVASLEFVKASTQLVAELQS